LGRPTYFEGLPTDKPRSTLGRIHMVPGEPAAQEPNANLLHRNCIISIRQVSLPVHVTFFANQLGEGVEVGGECMWSHRRDPLRPTAEQGQGPRPTEDARGG